MADGQVLIDSKLNTDGVERGTKELKKEMQDLAKVTSKVADAMEKELGGAGDSAEDAADSFGKLFKANISADLVTNALKAMGEAAVDLAKEAVAAAAEINASNAQFEQTFRGIESVARESLNNVAKQAGITATRMQDSYSAIFAFSKSIGADQTQALDISARAMAAAADSAAYYDKSVEEAAETLKSFLKGNYENDAALGIAATETTRNAKANELYAKSFNELSEAQKVDTLLAMVEAGNAASGAMGQAAREADSWTNVAAELQEAWRLLLAVLGDPILEGLIPIIQGITKDLQALIDTSASAELSDGMESFKESISGIDEEFNETSASIEKNAIMAQLYRDRLTELEAAGLDTAAAQREYAHAVDALNGIYPELNLQIDEQTGLLNENSRANIANLETMKQRALFAAKEKKYNAALEAQAEAIMDIEAAERALWEAQNDRKATEEQLIELTGKTRDQLIAAYQDGTLAAGQMSEAEAKLLIHMQQLDEEIGNLETGIEEGNAAIAAQDAELKVLNEDLSNTADELNATAEAENAVATAAESAADAQETLIDRYNETKEAARSSIDSQIGLFQELSLKSDMTAKKIVENWKTQQDAFANYAQNLQTAIDMGLDETLVQQLSDGSEKSMIILQALVDGTGASVEEINAQFAALSDARDSASTAMAGVQEGIDFELLSIIESTEESIASVKDAVPKGLEGLSGNIKSSFADPVQESMSQLGDTIGETFEDAADTMQESWKDKGQFFEQNVESPIKSSVENIRSTSLDAWSEIEDENALAWDRMVQNVEDAINRMQNKINSLQGKNIDVGTSGASATAYTPTEALASVPYLASGAVIPPNAPFMAVLGDQTHGTNIEAPLDTIKQAVAEVMADIAIRNEIVFSGDLAPLVRILYPEIKSESYRVGGSLAKEVVL